MNNEYTIKPFSEVKIGQQLEQKHHQHFSDDPWVKMSETNYACGSDSGWDGAAYFYDGCLVRTADCEPVPESSVEGVLKSIVIAMMDIQVNAADTLWINSSETVFERLWDIYTLHGGDEAVLKEAFPLYA